MILTLEETPRLLAGPKQNSMQPEVVDFSVREILEINAV